jgi:hypothetical protein
MSSIIKQTIQFTKDDWNTLWGACYDFAKKEIVTTERMRNKRGQFNREKMIYDTTIGKMGEWSVTWLFWKNNIDCSEPDMEIYEKHRKSFDADLTYDGVDLHVKSQCEEAARRYGTSFVFQKGGQGRGHTDPIIRSGDGQAIFAVVHESTMSAEIYGPITTDVLRDNLRDPKLDYLKKTKACLYLEDFTIKEAQNTLK